MKKILLLCIGLLLCLVTSCSYKVELNENEYVHSLFSIIDTNHTYKYKNALPDKMEGGKPLFNPMLLTENSEIIQAYKPLRQIQFKYVKDFNIKGILEYRAFCVHMYFGNESVAAYMKVDGTILFINMNNDYFISEPGVIDVLEYPRVFYVKK